MHNQSFRKIWGRRQARPLKVQQKSLLQDFLPALQIKLTPGEPCDLETIFSGLPEQVFLEIGFGGGEHLVERARQAPTAGFIGCEPFINGVASLLNHISAQNLQNVKIVVDDARLLLQNLKSASIDRIYILFPDPWPKKRHNKRRIISDETIADLSRVLKSGGQLFMATDIIDYAEWIQDVLAKRPEFSLALTERSTIYDRPIDWPHTRYEQKGLENGRPGAYFEYVKNGWLLIYGTV